MLSLVTTRSSTYPHCIVHISLRLCHVLRELRFLDVEFTLANYFVGQITLAVWKLATELNSHGLDVLVFQKTLKAINNVSVRNKLEWR